ncbi:endonuclease SmrB [Gayadomonas joobiniege]|uniref:endonuclease SmrB n=1 Tax=Gayadomonas joobiniege TaxID=1234606 RepID=UPI0003771AAD|nr:endonuclease SmrB [Gayadomonas joobiniege]
MTEKSKPDSAESEIFMQAMAGVKPLTHDKVVLAKKKTKKDPYAVAKKEGLREAAYYFSDDFSPYFPAGKAIAWVQSGYPTDLAKQLRKRLHSPEMVLDMHGMTKKEAKLELAEMISQARKFHSPCICIVHGKGSGILKEKCPAWLMQHPDVIAIHQAPLEWGGDGALLALLNLGQDFI